MYFFCLQNLKGKAKYVKLVPEMTVEETFRRFGRNDYLILIYADGDVGMKGIKKLEKVMMWIVAILAIIWAVLFSLNYYYDWMSGSSGSSGLGDETNGYSAKEEWM